MAQVTIEIYEPGSRSELWCTYETDTAPAYAVGHFLLPVDAPGAGPAFRLQITAVEHLIWNASKGGAARQKVMVYSRQIDTPDASYIDVG